MTKSDETHRSRPAPSALQPRRCGGGVSREERRSLPPDQFGRDTPLATSPQRAARRADAVGGVAGEERRSPPPDQFGRDAPLATSPRARCTPRRCGGGVGGGAALAPP